MLIFSEDEFNLREAVLRAFSLLRLRCLLWFYLGGIFRGWRKFDESLIPNEEVKKAKS